jgi:solute carrier family 29 (equilibrative nucleoside transporter) protein 4
LDTPPASAQPILSFSNPVYELSNPVGDVNLESSLMHSGESSMASSTVTATLNHDILSSPTGNAPGTAYKVEHVLSSPSTTNFRSFRRLRDGMDDRMKVAKAIFPYMTCIALAYCVTLALYPGLESEIISCNLKTWMPVLLMFTFNTTDVIVRIQIIISVKLRKL